MLFNTLQYFIFLPIVVIGYYILPKKSRYIWLLAASYYFYMQWNPLYITLLFTSTLLTYAAGRMIDGLTNPPVKHEEGADAHGLSAGINKRKLVFVVCIVLNLGILGFFKYFTFAVDCLNHLFRSFHMGEISWDYDILLPVGISFYTLQALGYLIDVYRGEIRAEKNFIRYALFVSFFPQLVAGPIERSRNLLAQLSDSRPFSYENLRRGMLLILYGLFLKMVISDRLAIMVDTVYGDSAAYPGCYIVAATVFFAIQIYCDFYGYSTIARGSALLMGIHLMDNFNAPYFSKSVKEFWRRWHISLSSWFRDYLYIPLGGNRKGVTRKELNHLLVFAVSGLWHGASMSYVFWGFLNGIYQIAEDAVSNIRKSADDCFSRRVFQRILTFSLVTLAWLFFRAGTFANAGEMLTNIFASNNWVVLMNGSLYNLGVPESHMKILLVSILLLFLIDYQKYQGKDVVEIFLRQGWFFRVLAILFFVYVILLYGCYGEMFDTQQFIYFQF